MKYVLTMIVDVDEREVGRLFAEAKVFGETLSLQDNVPTSVTDFNSDSVIEYYKEMLTNSGWDEKTYVERRKSLGLEVKS